MSRARERLAELPLDLGLVGGVGVARGAAHRLLLVDQRRHAAVEAVGGDRGRVDQPPGARGGGRLEDVARAGQVDLAALAAAGDDHEGEVDDDVGVLDQVVDRLAVEHVAAPVLGLLPTLPGRSKGRRAIPMTRSTSGERSSAEMNARPISPVGPVTATVSMARFCRKRVRDDDGPSISVHSSAHVYDLDQLLEPAQIPGVTGVER